MRSFVLSLLFLAFSSPCNGADAGAFIEPTDGSGSVGASFITNPVWYVGDAHTLKWTTSQTTYNITLWQQNATTNAAHYGYSPVFSWSATGRGPGTYDWVVQPGTLGLDIKDYPVFFLFCGPGSSVTEAGFTSRYFNISSAKPSSSSSSVSTSTPTTSPSLSSIGTVPTTTIAGSVAATSSTTSMKVGLGVGLGIGIPALLIIGVLMGMRLVKSRRGQNIQSEPVPAYYDAQPDYHDAKPIQQVPQELPAQQGPTHHRAELYGSERRME